MIFILTNNQLLNTLKLLSSKGFSYIIHHLAVILINPSRCLNLFISYCGIFTLRKDLNKITKSTC
nr:MAG TPA: hypothetical protein [Caudoviricetes sp.]